MYPTHSGLEDATKNYYNIKEGIYECRVNSVFLTETSIIFTVTYFDYEDKKVKYLYSKYFIGEASLPLTKTLLIPVVEYYCNTNLKMDISINELVNECQALKFLVRTMYMEVRRNGSYKNVRFICK